MKLLKFLNILFCILNTVDGISNYMHGNYGLATIEGCVALFNFYAAGLADKQIQEEENNVGKD